MGKLRGIVDAGESFSRSHGVVSPRTYKRETPEWSLNKHAIRVLLLRAFPKLATEDRQRDSAARWATVIHLYFRMGYTRGQIAEELDTTTERVKGVIRSIYRVSEGRRADGKSPLKRLKKSTHAPKLS
jgi:hypothetical protein